jgi:DNA mismatch repair protein MutS2
LPAWACGGFRLEAGSQGSTLNGNSFRALEFESIRAALLSFAGSSGGRERLQALAPRTDVASVRQSLARTSQAVAVVAVAGRQPYHDLPDVAEAVAQARVEGLHLEPPALTDIASFIEGSTDIARRVTRCGEHAPQLAALAGRVEDASTIAQAIRRAILPSGEISDDASPKLRETRRAITRLRERLHSVMESFLRGKDADRLLQDKLVTTRNDRYVLLLKAEQRGQLPGIIHGSSGSGASFFVEPLPAVELNNDIVALVEEERAEVVRILRELTGAVGARAPDLLQAVEVMGELDELQARALLAREMRAAPPAIADELRLELRDARHPLLMPRVAERAGAPRRSSADPVPVTIRVGFGSPVLVISGPNTGGKTVALKTVGLLVLMAQCGLHIPAAEGSILPVFRRIYADIGDEQSIAQNLSTFSAHLAAVVEMTRDLALPALVLLDEVGAGTDPTEGGALGVAIVDAFRRQGAMVVATTHHGLMKAYAQSTAGVACASFGYDPRSYEPTYRLDLGAPGRSLALEMAERLGLPKQIVDDARARRNATEAQAEELLKTLELKEAALQREEERVSALRREVEQARESARAEERALAERKRSEVEAFAKELRRRADEAARQAADAIQRAVQKVDGARRAAAGAGTRARGEALAEIRQAHEAVLKDESLGIPPEPERPPAQLEVGSRVRLADLGVVGEVLELPAQGPLEVAVSGKRLRVPRSAISAVLDKPKKHGTASNLGGGVAVKKPAGVPAEINLVGMRVDEALPRVDKLLDDAALSDRREIRVIHGFGEGRLRRAVVSLLEGHPHVASFRPGGPGEGGAGATIVELKD